MASTSKLDHAEKSELFAQWRAEYENDPEYISYGLLMEVTDMICREMDAQGMTRRELAERLGVSPQYVTKFLNAPSNTTLRQIVRFANALGLKVHNPMAREKLSAATGKPRTSRVRAVAARRSAVSPTG